MAHKPLSLSLSPGLRLCYSFNDLLFITSRMKQSNVKMLCMICCNFDFVKRSCLGGRGLHTPGFRVWSSKERRREKPPHPKVYGVRAEADSREGRGRGEEEGGREEAEEKLKNKTFTRTYKKHITLSFLSLACARCAPHFLEHAGAQFTVHNIYFTSLFGKG